MKKFHHLLTLPICSDTNTFLETEILIKTLNSYAEKDKGVARGRKKKRKITRPAWAGFKTAEEGRAKNM